MGFIRIETHFSRNIPPPKITNVDERLSIRTAEFKITKCTGFTIFMKPVLNVKIQKTKKTQT